MFRLFANTNTAVETVENFANTVGLMMSLNSFFNKDDVSDEALMIMATFSFMLSLFKFYFVNKQNKFFATQYEKEDKLIDDTEATQDIESMQPTHGEEGHRHSHGEEGHGHSHGLPHDKLSGCQSFVVNINFINHVVNYSSAAISLTGVVLNDLLEMQPITSVKITIVGVGAAIGIAGALARRRNDAKVLMNDMSKLSACGHAHAEGDDKTKWVSPLNAGVEVMGSLSSNFILCTSSYSLINTSLKNVTLDFVIASAGCSAVLALFSFYTHNALNDFFKGLTHKDNSKTTPHKHDFWTYLKLVGDTINHGCDYTAMMIYVAAFVANKTNYTFSMPARGALLVAAGLFSIAGSISPFMNESKAMASTSTKRFGHG